ncbi:hypothetical protein VTK73DRAFT_4283 [Phialemonium thermophilum]|uniref:Uncharacterized protein n=1 Tax=Phialemonium thermophilum TaxID=223376 RepID=A0ABR3WU13_9PEZI
MHGSRGRAAAFFLGIVFIFSQLSINVVGNVLAGGLDVASVFPKYINLRRGAYILAALSVLPNPWQQLAKGSTFLSVLSAYAVFLGPMIGLLCVHFYFIQHRVFQVPDLYEGSSKSLYWYHMGVNWRTAAAWVLAVVPSMPGFVASVNTSVHLGTAANRIFSLSFLLGFFLCKCLSTPHETAPPGLKLYVLNSTTRLTGVVWPALAGFFAYLFHWLFPYQYPREATVLDGNMVMEASQPVSDADTGHSETGKTVALTKSEINV